MKNDVVQPARTGTSTPKRAVHIDSQARWGAVTSVIGLFAAGISLVISFTSTVSLGLRPGAGTAPAHSATIQPRPVAPPGHSTAPSRIVDLTVTQSNSQLVFSGRLVGEPEYRAVWFFTRQDGTFVNVIKVRPTVNGDFRAPVPRDVVPGSVDVIVGTIAADDEGADELEKQVLEAPRRALPSPVITLAQLRVAQHLA